MKKTSGVINVPVIPLIADDLGSNVGYRDTLDRIEAVLRLLAEINISEGLSPKAETGLYWVQLMLIDSVRYLSLVLNSQK